MKRKSLSPLTRQKAAKAFVERWKDQGNEKSQAQSFWIELLHEVYGVVRPTESINFEYKIQNFNHTNNFIDGLIKETGVLIEQKSKDVNLDVKEKQSDGSMKTPFEQARNYNDSLNKNEQPNWIILSNFREFRIHDMNDKKGKPVIIPLEKLPERYREMDFLIDSDIEKIRRELNLSIEAGNIVGQLYKTLLSGYKEPVDEAALKSLNMLCVRIVFCLYAEKAGLFKYNAFTEFLAAHKANIRTSLKALFEVLNTPEDKRDPYLDDDLAEFPYVNGGLFKDSSLIIPKFSDKVFTLIQAENAFRWQEISPTIFGAVFESTLNPETRRSNGMHYTSVENIHKVIDPLFLDELKERFKELKKITNKDDKYMALEAFQNELASINILDPACGSGNFLTESYLSLRKLENEVIRILYIEGKKVNSTGANNALSRSNTSGTGQIALGFDEEELSPIKVSISQFHGIEVNDFAVTVARTALWIAESQMMKETEQLLLMDIDFLPLKTQANIVEANALRIDWKDVVSQDKLSYIIGNPPFVGKSLQTKSQKEDMESIFASIQGKGNLDYVACWFKKATDYIGRSNIQAAFVATNSVCQGIAVPPLWGYMFEQGMKINFAYSTFRWGSEAQNKAQVHCVIVGFGFVGADNKYLYSDDTRKSVSQISPYLIPGDNTIVKERKEQISGEVSMLVGSFPVDGGNLVLNPSTMEDLIKKESLASKYIRKYIGPEELIKGKDRYCLWLPNIDPHELNSMPAVKERVKKVKDYRLTSPKLQTRNKANTPTLFGEIRQPDSNYIMIPRTSSEKRNYLPMGFFSKDVIAGDTIILPTQDIYMFGVLTSNIHMAWMRTVAGRLESRYRYSNTIVYNTFPWPTPTDKQKEKIRKTAQAILDARDLYPNDSLADLYDPLTMPPELLKAHKANDKAVREAYGFKPRISDPEIVSNLFKMYSNLIGDKEV